MQTPQFSGPPPNSKPNAESMSTDLAQVSPSTECRCDLRFISDCIPGPIARFDRECRYLFVNKYTVEHLGLLEVDILGRHVAQIIGLDAFERVRPYFDRVLSGDEVEYEKYSANHYGESRYMLNRLIPERDPNGVVYGFVFFGLDITERKRAEEAREEAFRRLFKFASRLPGAIYQYRLKPDETSYFPYASENMEAILGLRQDLLDSDAVSAFARIHFEDHESVLKSIRTSATNLTPWSWEFRVVDDDGTTRWLSGDAMPEREPDGSTLWHGYAADITERKRIEIELRDITDNLELAQSLAKIGSWTYQIKTKKTIWSKHLFRLFNLSEDSPPLGIPQVYSLFHPDDVANLREAFEKTAEFGEPYSLVCRRNCAEENNIYVRCDGRARVNEDGDVIEVYGTVMDVTETIQREELLKSAHRNAEAANIAKSEFLANMSHEIRTPLTSILGFADVLIEDCKRPEPSVERLHVLETISHAGQHLLSVVSDILDLSKVEADMIVLRPAETLLAILFQDIQKLVGPLADAKGLTLTFTLNSAIPERVYCDPTRLRQILLNLIGNAIKFTDEGSVSVSVQMGSQDGHSILVVDVEDTGCGISLDQAKLLFKPFSQVDGSVRREHGGTGLGLAISKRMANLMKGDVAIVCSELKRGSVFRVSLPMDIVPGCELITSLRLESRQKESLHIESTIPFKLNGRILLVEDGIDNQKLIAFHLRKVGAHVKIADNGKVALEMVENSVEDGEAFDLVLTDIQMPEMDGLELTRRLRERGCTLPIVAITAHALSEDKQRCFDAGCNDYETKPINKSQLLKTCQKWLNAPSRRDSTP